MKRFLFVWVLRLSERRAAPVGGTVASGDVRVVGIKGGLGGCDLMPQKPVGIHRARRSTHCVFMLNPALYIMQTCWLKYGKSCLVHWRFTDHIYDKSWWAQGVFLTQKYDQSCLAHFARLLENTITYLVWHMVWYFRRNLWQNLATLVVYIVW